MKTHTSDFKNNIALMGRKLDSKLTYTSNGSEITLDNEQLNIANPHYKADILKSVMKQLDVDSNVEIPVDTVVNYQFGVKTRSGKNICPTDFSNWESGQYNTSGPKVDYPARLRVKELIPVLPSTTYYVNCFSNNDNLIFREYDSNKTFLTNIS